MTSIDDSRIMALNNQGAASIAVGDTDAAVESLSLALQLSKSNLHGQSNLNAGPLEPPPSTFDELGRMMEASLLAMQCYDTGKSASSGSSSNDFVYRTPISFPSTGPLEYAMVSSIVIFNMALAHHLMALDEAGDIRVLPLRKAQRLYELAICLVSPTESGGDGGMLFILSCVNNLGNVHQLLGDTPTSEKYFQELLSILMFVTSNGIRTSQFVSLFYGSVFRGQQDVAPAA